MLIKEDLVLYIKLFGQIINKWSKDEKKWIRFIINTVALKSLDKSSNLNEEFLNEV